MSKKSFWYGFLTGIVVAGLGLLFIVEKFVIQPDVSLNEMQVEDLEGKQLKITEMLGKPIVINYWATWCIPCREEFPDFEKVKKQFEGKVVFLMVSDEKNTKIQDFKDKNPYSFTYLKAVKGFEDINSRPVTFIYDKNGQLIEKHVGTMDKDVLLKILNKEVVK